MNLLSRQKANQYIPNNLSFDNNLNNKIYKNNQTKAISVPVRSNLHPHAEKAGVTVHPLSHLYHILKNMFYHVILSFETSTQYAYSFITAYLQLL